MIDMTVGQTASPVLQTLKTDPGKLWIKDLSIAINAPPDTEISPLPESNWGNPRWKPDPIRTGICGVVSPRVIRLSGGTYRLYYTQILPRSGHPQGATDYDNSTTRILSALSNDGSTWTPEPGVRLTSQEGGAGEFRVVSSEVVPTSDRRVMRMYYECCPGPQSGTSSIRSAISTEGGTKWEVEPGERLAALNGNNYSSPRIVFLEDGRCRLYCLSIGKGIVSAISHDGITFQLEPGLRISQEGRYDSVAAFASEIFRLENGGYVMYYAGYSAPNRAYILRATSTDGLNWKKDSEPLISPADEGWSSVKCSEMCLFQLPTLQGPTNENQTSQFRLLYEACDGTAPGQRGVWRIASATTPKSPLT